jgi:hypothetical protein
MLITVGKLLNPHCLKNVKYYVVKKGVDDCGHFTELSGALDDSMGVPSRNISVFMDNCATYIQDLSFLQNVKLVYCPPGGVVVYSS